MLWILYGVILIINQRSEWYRSPTQYRRGIQPLVTKLSLTLAYASHTFKFDKSVVASPIFQVPIRPINPYIRHWESAKFERQILEDAHQSHVFRRKRAIENYHKSYENATFNNEIKLQFNAHNRDFKLILRQDPGSIFASDVHIENSVGDIGYDTTRIYSGRLEDDDESQVHGVLTSDNLFDGMISTNVEKYYIEPASRYSNDLVNQGVHSVVYKISDVDLNNNLAHECASEQLHRRRKREITHQNEVNSIETARTIKRTKRLANAIKIENSRMLSTIDLPYNDELSVKHDTSNNSQDYDQRKHSKNILVNNFNPNNDYNQFNRNPFGNNVIGNSYDPNGNNNNTRTSQTNLRPSHKTHIDIITRHRTSKKPNIIVNNYNPDIVLSGNFNNKILNYGIRNGVNDRPQAYDRKSTCMLYLQADHTFSQKMGSDEASIEAITRHVQRANMIYKNTDFDGDGKPDNITFMIKRIKIHNTNALKDPSYRFPGNYGVEKFLELFSEEDYDAFCLAYMFTYRDFEMGTLGLAWTGDLKNAGGVCEKNGHYRGSLKSLNTGIVTLLNYGKHVPPAVSHVTLAHEIGHNFGSPHDPEQCTPGGEDGNYIMFARATSGDKKNNNKFSTCSINSIEPVLKAKARNNKGCFTEPQQAICGNGVVEAGEECDCGWEDDCKDSCCFPMTLHPHKATKPCTLTPFAKCSPSQGPCCTEKCSLKIGEKCRDDNGCRDPSFCDGIKPQCPLSRNKPNKTICNKEFVCFMGECTGSICLAYGLESCQCIPGPKEPTTKACELCCKKPGEGNECKSSFQWNMAPFDVPDMFAKPGTPCNDYNGYCDVFQQCREVDPSGPLATLRKLLLSEESIASFRQWLLENWYTVLLIIAFALALFILTIKLLGKESKKKKSVTIIHSATTETVRLPDNNAGVIVHTAVRTKVPFKKKVRGERAKKYKSSAQKVNDSSKKDHKNVKKDNSRSQKASPSKVPVKQERVRKPKLNNKEIINYSNLDNLQETNTLSKVQKWLVDSQNVTAPFKRNAQHPSNIRSNVKNSTSSPENVGKPLPKQKPSVSGGNNEKVKLQVVYKPPFKFNLKLSKNMAIKTKILAPSKNHIKRKLTAKNNVKVDPQKSNNKPAGQRVGHRRTGLLIKMPAQSSAADKTINQLTPIAFKDSINLSNAAAESSISTPPVESDESKRQRNFHEKVNAINENTDHVAIKPAFSDKRTRHSSNKSHGIRKSSSGNVLNKHPKQLRTSSSASDLNRMLSKQTKSTDATTKFSDKHSSDFKEVLNRKVSMPAGNVVTSDKSNLNEINDISSKKKEVHNSMHNISQIDSGKPTEEPERRRGSIHIKNNSVRRSTGNIPRANLNSSKGERPEVARMLSLQPGVASSSSSSGGVAKNTGKIDKNSPFDWPNIVPPVNKKIPDELLSPNLEKTKLDNKTIGNE